MSTRRIEDPRYGMVVTDGVAQRVFMLIRRMYPFSSSWEEMLVWRAACLNADGSVAQGVVYLAPGEWAEVIP